MPNPIPEVPRPERATILALVTSATAPFPGAPEALDRALRLLSDLDSWETGVSSKPRAIDPATIIAEPWNEGRLERAREKLAAGEKAPPVRLTGFRVPISTKSDLRSTLRLYVPSDGIHRTAAAREAERYVYAKIDGFYPVSPRRFYVDRYGERLALWRYVAPEDAKYLGTYFALEDVVTENEARALRALGVYATPAVVSLLDPAPAEAEGGTDGR